MGGGAEKRGSQAQKIIPGLIPCSTSNETRCQKSKDPVHISLISCLCSPNRTAGRGGQGGNITKWRTQARSVCAAWNSRLLAGSSRTDKSSHLHIVWFLQMKDVLEMHICMCVYIYICLFSKCNNANRALSTDCFAS